MNINELGARIDRPTIRELIAYATCRNRPISNSTLLRMEKDGRIPYRLKTHSHPPYGTPRSFGSPGVTAIKKRPIRAFHIQTAFVFPTASNRRQVADFGQHRADFCRVFASACAFKASRAFAAALRRLRVSADRPHRYRLFCSRAASAAETSQHLDGPRAVSDGNGEVVQGVG